MSLYQSSDYWSFRDAKTTQEAADRNALLYGSVPTSKNVPARYNESYTQRNDAVQRQTAPFSAPDYAAMNHALSEFYGNVYYGVRKAGQLYGLKKGYEAYRTASDVYDGIQLGRRAHDAYEEGKKKYEDLKKEYEDWKKQFEDWKAQIASGDNDPHQPVKPEVSQKLTVKDETPGPSPIDDVHKPVVVNHVTDILPTPPSHVNSVAVQFFHYHTPAHRAWSDNGIR